MDSELIKKILAAQKSEITEHVIYKKLWSQAAGANNYEILEKISSEELVHYYFWKTFTKSDVEPDKAKVVFYTFLARILGLSFTLKLMESGEGAAQGCYENLKALDPKVENVIAEEEKHEKDLLELIDEERLKYTGSMVLGLNDALVELTAALSGFTLALQNTKLIAITGLIMGIAAAFSMAATGYLSAKEEGGRNPGKSCVYTGVTYVLTVLLLIFPYFLFKNPYFCLGITVFCATSVIFIFNFYVSVAKSLSFKKRFWEMFTIAIGVAGLNFAIGLLIRKYFNLGV